MDGMDEIVMSLLGAVVATELVLLAWMMLDAAKRERKRVVDIDEAMLLLEKEANES